MSDNPQYEVLRQFADDGELLQALQTGNYDDKKHALLNVAYSDSEGEAALDLFLSYLKDPELKYVAYLSINMFLETCRSYPLLKVLPVLIIGVDNEEQYISSHCASALENLVSAIRRAATLILASFSTSVGALPLEEVLDKNF